MRWMTGLLGVFLVLSVSACELSSRKQDATVNLSSTETDEQAYASAIQADTPGAYIEFLQTHPGSVYATDIARRYEIIKAAESGAEGGSEYSTTGRYISYSSSYSSTSPSIYEFVEWYGMMTPQEAYNDAMQRRTLNALSAFNLAHGNSVHGPSVAAEIARFQRVESTPVPSSGQTSSYALIVSELAIEDQRGLAMLGYTAPTVDPNTLEAFRQLFPAAPARSDGAMRTPGLPSSGRTTTVRTSTQTQPPDSTISTGFHKGRIIHHAPNSMVLDRTYFLEIAIQPITRDTTMAEIDSGLTATIGSGNVADSPEPEIETEIQTIRAAELMSAKLSGSGFEITATTDPLQPLFAGEPTKWQWEVIPRRSGEISLTFAVARQVTVGGQQVNQTVRTISRTISVESLEDLLVIDPEPGLQIAVSSQSSRSAAQARSIGSSLIGAGTLVSSVVPPQQTGAAACTTVPGRLEDRFALLITNLDYSGSITRLTETHRDGERMAAALEEVGFAVTHCRDIGRTQTIRELSQLGLDVKARMDADGKPVSFFYYSGHGVNLNNQNYILPVDLTGTTSVDVRDGAVTFEDIFNRVSISPLSFVVFDACRTVMSDETKGFMRAYEPARWMSGLFQAFATEPGKPAIDDGLYSRTLSEMMVELSEPANVLFKRVQDQVGQATEFKQNPNYIDRTLGGEFFFRPS